jgi:hypothetical protein
VLESPRDTTRWRFKLGVQNHFTFKLKSRMHTTSDLDVLHMHRKLVRYNFQQKQSHGQLKSKSPGIVKTRSVFRTFQMLHHLFWDDDPCIELESIRGAS